MNAEKFSIIYPINNPADIKPNLSTSVFTAEKPNAKNRISTRTT